MSARERRVARGLRPARRRLAATSTLVGALAAALVLLHSGGQSHAASGAAPVTAQTEDAVPARNVVMIGATPEEPGAGSGETWGIGAEGSSSEPTVLVRYSAQEGWVRGPALPSAFTLAPDDLLAAQMTSRGDGAMVGTIGKREVVLARSAGGGFTPTALVGVEGEEPAEGEAGEGHEAEKPALLLEKGEELFSERRAALMAPIDESSGGAGVLVVPVSKNAAGIEHRVLHWNGNAWSSEPIDIPAASAASFRVLAIAASSPQNAWLLGQLASEEGGYPAGAVALFRRVEESGSWSWKPVALEAGGGNEEAHPLYVPASEGTQVPFIVPGSGQPPSAEGQLLTVTNEGVWVDGARGDLAGVDASATLYFKPEGSLGGTLQASWCLPPPATPSACTQNLPQPIPRTNMRSIAWPGGGQYGSRVITGLAGGVSLRLEGSSFQEVLSLGGGGLETQNPGAAYGAAFTSPSEGWLGDGSMPVRLTGTAVPSELRPWPVPFRRDLQAIAAAPGQPVGALGSEAIAVGRLGAVARYKPGEGWTPESLFGPGESVERPNLRAVAWPTPMRAFAVGDEGQMWLWRGETGLWERDPATPINFRDNLLGIAFDPDETTRGYALGTTAVGWGGVILRYGKTWTEETELPSEVQGAQFLGIAFAGSEAIVPFVKQISALKGTYAGGLLVNNGSGWRVETEATGLLQSSGSVPVSVAALPDGGAAFATSSGKTGPRVIEREASGAPWKATPQPLPGINAGSLALFRENGALRAMVTGGGSVHVSTARENEVPPGNPGNFEAPLEPLGGPETGSLLRQTTSGWSDQRHEVDVGQAPLGDYEFQDLPYTPDPLMAMLVSPTGSSGWTVGGHVGEEVLQTADIERYGEDDVTPDGEQPAAVPTHAGWATIAVGGDAECDDPCSERSLAKVGPQVWLESALSLAATSDARAFIYTGPSVTEGKVEGHRTVPIPFAAELERNADILASGVYPSGAQAGQALPAYAVPSPPDLDARPESEGTERTFEGAFSRFPQQALIEANGQPASCADAVGCEDAYYAFSSQGEGGTVRVIVLDETAAEVTEAQLSWLEGELQAAHTAKEPAIVIGSGDIEAQISAGRSQSATLAKILVTGSRVTPAGTCEQLEQEAPANESGCSSASAYFYDAPEQNEHRPLQVGGESIETYGSGTLGYIQKVHELAGNFHGASGIMLAQINIASRNPVTNRAEVAVPLVPVVGELALEAEQGTLLRRSEPALFAGLARRPRAGCDAEGQQSICEVDPYIPVPTICTGECGTVLLPEYGFKSSDPEVGAFVKPNLGSTSRLAVLQNSEGKAIVEPETGEGATSGLFCAFNPGSTTVTITAGDWSASLQVTVQRGSVREPCGTVKLSHPPAVENPSTPSPAPAPAPQAAAPAPSSPPPVLPPAPPPPVRAAVPPPPTPAVHTAAYFIAAIPTTPVLAFVPPPVPTPARPSPPSGTSAVTSPVEVAQEEEESEEAPESVSSKAVAYSPDEGGSPLPYLLGIALIGALAGVSARRRPRRRERALAHAELADVRPRYPAEDLTRRRRGRW